MKFSISSLALSRALETVSGALPSKADKEILKCILLKRKGDQLELRATDIQLSIQHRFPVAFSSEPDEELDLIAVPAKRFLESCRSLPDVPVTFEVKKGYAISFTHDRGSYSWIGFNGNSFPDLPEDLEGQSIQFSRERLKSGFNLVGFAAAKDISRPGMMGVLFEILNGSARIVATDGHRLARCIFNHYVGEQDVRALIPLKAFSQLVRIDGPSECTLQINDDFIVFDSGSTQLVSRLINASFPNYERAIPNENDKIVHLDREEILGSVSRINLFASENSHQILLDCKENSIHVSAQDLERSSKGAESISCEYDAEPTRIGFNAEYLLDLLRNLPSEEISLAMGTPNRAALLRPGAEREQEDLTFLLMPVMLNKL